MLFMQTDRADETQPINLHHVVTFKKAGSFGNWSIWFDTVNGETIWWKYRNNKAHRDLDYKDIMRLIGLSEQEESDD